MLNQPALTAITSYNRAGEIVKPIETGQVEAYLQNEQVSEEFRRGARAIREVGHDLEPMGVVETWIDPRGREGRVNQIETTFDPEWVRAAHREHIGGKADGERSDRETRP